MPRAQIRETLKQIETASSAELLGRAASKQLTSKQRAFARKVAMGKTKAQAYREAYNPNPAPTTILTSPYKVASDARVQREIEALQQAELAASMQTPAQLRALVIQTLVQTAIDPDCKPAVRVQAAKVLGTVTEVAAFTTRTETRVTHSAEDAKAKVLEEIKALMLGSADAVDVEAKSLLAELTEQGGEYAPAQVVDLYRDADQQVPKVPPKRAPETPKTAKIP
jgi:hypothetical protein